MDGLDILIEDPRWAALELPRLANAAATETLRTLGLDPGTWEIAILACDDPRIAALNTEFRDKPAPTNVLSWPSAERGAATDGERPIAPDPSDPELGDIAISYDTCLREAQDSGKSLPDHVSHLVVHGILHLLGYDHQRDRDASLMEQIEVEILGKLGLPDPYCQD